MTNDKTTTLTDTPAGTLPATAAVVQVCQHTPRCPAPDACDASAARIVADHLDDCGYALLCNGRVLLEGDDSLLPAQRDRRPLSA